MLQLQQLLLNLLTIWLKAHNSHIIPVITVVIRRPWAKLQQLLFDLLTVLLKAHNSHIIPVITVVIRRPGAKVQQLLFDLLTVWLKAHNSHVIRVIAVVIRRPGAKFTLIYLSFCSHAGDIVQPYWSCPHSKFTYWCWHSKCTVRGWCIGVN